MHVHFFSRMAFAIAAMLVPLTCASAQSLKPTPQDTEGPYYPRSWAGEVDADLVNFAGKPYTRGARLEISGVVQSASGAAIPNATVEIWQADEEGRYRHPGDDGEGPAQRGFQAYGRMQTDAAGRYRFLTIKPKLYGGRPAHVHFRVVAPGFTPLTTQMYFAGENQERGLTSMFGGFSKERDALTVTPTRVSDAGNELIRTTLNIVLAAER